MLATNDTYYLDDEQQVTAYVRDDLIALFAGVLLTFSFAPFRYALLALLAPALFLYSLHFCNAKRAAFRGYLFGISFFGTAVSWVYVSIHNYGQAPLHVAILFTILFVLFLALYPAGKAYLLQKYFSQQEVVKNLLAFPALWILFEWLRSYFMTGFPWALLGYTQTNTALSGLAPLIGVYGLSGLLCLCAGILVLALRSNSSKYYPLLAFILAIWISGAALQKHNWTKPLGKPVSVSLLQGNTGMPQQWSADFVENALRVYQQMTVAAINSDIIVWPESAIPMPMQANTPFLTELSELAKAHNTTVIAGAPMPIPNSQQYYNATFALGAGSGQYFKRNLVPFGEYTPYPEIALPIMRYFQLPLPDFIPGPSQQKNLVAAGINLAPFICYEIAYSRTIRSDMPQANLLMTISNDSWFGHSFAAAQHLQIGQMRSLETGRAQLFASNTGRTAIIDPHGGIIIEADPFTQTMLNGTVQPMQGSTPWIIYGDTPSLLLALVMLLLAAAFRLFQR